MKSPDLEIREIFREVDLDNSIHRMAEERGRVIPVDTGFRMMRRRCFRKSK